MDKDRLLSLLVPGLNGTLSLNLNNSSLNQLVKESMGEKQILLRDLR